MRNIKFRVWCKNKQEWEKDYLLLDAYGSLYDLNHHVTVSRENHILMQYTGLKDCNGTEIFEGDIVEYSVGVMEDTGVVKWGNKRGGFVVKHQFIEYPTKSLKTKYYSIPSNSYVIGNIYENANLLENK